MRKRPFHSPRTSEFTLIFTELIAEGFLVKIRASLSVSRAGAEQLVALHTRLQGCASTYVDASLIAPVPVQIVRLLADPSGKWPAPKDEPAEERVRERSRSRERSRERDRTACDADASFNAASFPYQPLPLPVPECAPPPPGSIAELNSAATSQLLMQMFANVDEQRRLEVRLNELRAEESALASELSRRPMMPSGEALGSASGQAMPGSQVRGYIAAMRVTSASSRTAMLGSCSTGTGAHALSSTATKLALASNEPLLFSGGHVAYELHGLDENLLEL